MIRQTREFTLAAPDGKIRPSFDGMPLDSFFLALVRTGAKTPPRGFPENKLSESGLRYHCLAAIRWVIMNTDRQKRFRAMERPGGDPNPREWYGRLSRLLLSARTVLPSICFGTVTSGTARFRFLPGYTPWNRTMWKIPALRTMIFPCGPSWTKRLPWTNFVQEKGDAKTGNRALHFWSSRRIAFRVEQQITGLNRAVCFPSQFTVTQVTRPWNLWKPLTVNSVRIPMWTAGNFREPVIADILVSDGTITRALCLATARVGIT